MIRGIPAKSLPKKTGPIYFVDLSDQAQVHQAIATQLISERRKNVIAQACWPKNLLGSLPGKNYMNIQNKNSSV